jgi:hypothetical protein
LSLLLTARKKSRSVTFRVDDEDVAQLRQRVGQTFEAVVISRLGQADFLVADVADQLVDVDRRDLERLEHLGCVLGYRPERALQAILGVEIVLMIRNDPADRQNQQGEHDRRAQQPP